MGANDADDSRSRWHTVTGDQFKLLQKIHPVLNLFLHKTCLLDYTETPQALNVAE